MRFALTLALAPALAFAQPTALAERGGPLRLSLKQAVDIATAPEGNTRVQLAEELLRQSRSRSAQARAALLPNLDSYITAQNQTRNLAAVGIQFNVPGFQSPEKVGPFSVFDARVTGTQSILDFSSIRRFQASRSAVRGSEADADSTRDQVTQQVVTLYFNALAAQANVEAAQASVQLADALAKLAENRRSAGTGTAIESTRAQVQVANERQNLLVTQNQRRQAELQLMRAMGMNLGSEVELTDKLEYKPADPVEVKDAVAKALTGRADWKAQQRREDSARLNYSGTKLERLPALAAAADYGSIGNRVSNAFPTRTYGVQLRVPVFDGGRRDARRAESLSQLRSEQVRSADLRDQIELEIRLALDALHSAEDQVNVAEEGLRQSQQEVAQAERRYEAGVANSIEPTDAQTRLARARANRISALLNYNVARVNLSYAMGAVREVIP